MSSSGHPSERSFTRITSKLLRTVFPQPGHPSCQKSEAATARTTDLGPLADELVLAACEIQVHSMAWQYTVANTFFSGSWHLWLHCTACLWRPRCVVGGGTPCLPRPTWQPQPLPNSGDLPLSEGVSSASACRCIIHAKMHACPATTHLPLFSPCLPGRRSSCEPQQCERPDVMRRTHEMARGYVLNYIDEQFDAYIASGEQYLFGGHHEGKWMPPDRALDICYAAAVSPVTGPKSV